MLKPPWAPPGTRCAPHPCPRSQAPGASRSQGQAPLRSRPRPPLRPPSSAAAAAPGGAAGPGLVGRVGSGGEPAQSGWGCRRCCHRPPPAPPAWRSAVTDAHLIRPAAGTAQRRSHPPPAAGEGAAPAGRGKVKLQQQSCSPSVPPGLPRPPGGGQTGGPCPPYLA